MDCLPTFSWVAKALRISKASHEKCNLVTNFHLSLCAWSPKPFITPRKHKDFFSGLERKLFLAPEPCVSSSDFFHICHYGRQGTHCPAHCYWPTTTSAGAGKPQKWNCNFIACIWNDDELCIFFQSLMPTCLKLMVERVVNASKVMIFPFLACFGGAWWSSSSASVRQS